MKKLYSSPVLVNYGSLVDRTGIFGGPAAGDVLLDQDGNIESEGKNSIDACAEKDGKCICEDNNTC